MKILIAEDDVTSRSILAAILRKWGYDPLATEDGNAAWEALQQADAPRLVLLDGNMPGMDGLDICRRIRKVESSDPPYLILITGRGQKGDIVQGLEAGANDYVTKPYNNEELQARIRVGQRMLDLQSRLLEARNALENLARHDPLTGILNRRAILDRIGQEISRAKRQGGELTVGMCDLDHFKNVNDTYGHQAGDQVLIAFTKIVQGQLRDYDSVGRYGGEEFLVVTTGKPGQTAKDLYERLKAGVAGTPIQTKSGTIPLTVSIGAVTGTGRSTVDGLLAAADAALYQAKASGRNRVVMAGPEPSGEAVPTVASSTKTARKSP